MIICFDLDGTLYDSFTHNFSIDQKIRSRLGYEEFDIRNYKTKFDATDWVKTYESLGYSNEDAKKALDLWHEEADKTLICELIPGAKQILDFAEKLVGRENVAIITNQDLHRIKVWFERDGLLHYLPDVKNSPQGKAHLFKELFESTNQKIVYIGDLVSDGKECEKVRSSGVNIVFIAITHQYSFNDEKSLLNFCDRRDWCFTANNFNKLKEILPKI